MKFVAGKMNMDIFEILDIANTKPYGYRRFNPGPGIGGHCIPIDPHYLYWKARKVGISANFIKLAAETILKVINYIKSKIIKIINKNNLTIKNTRILILGLAYKKNMDDLRESASLKIIDNLNKNKFKQLSYYDPHIKNDLIIKKYSYLNKISKIRSGNLKKFDIVILMTDHDIFDYNAILKHSKNIIDCRGRFKVTNKIVRA